MKTWMASAFCLLAILIACSCSSGMESDIAGEGTLRVLPIEVRADSSVELLTRAVDEALQVDIMQGSTVVRTYQAGSEELDALISLPVGSYTLYAHTPYMGEAPSGEQGTATYAVSRDFQIRSGQTTTLGNLQAAQSNVGLFLQYQAEDFAAAFPTLVCTITSPSTGRTVEVTGTDNKELSYFNVPTDGVLQYSFVATNADGETFQSAVKSIRVSEAKNFYLLIGWD